MTEKTQPLIVVGVDGSDDGLRAVRFGTGAALRRDGELLLVNAVDDTLMAGAWGVVYDPEVLQAAGVTANEQAKGIALEAGLPADRIRTALHAPASHDRQAFRDRIALLIHLRNRL